MMTATSDAPISGLLRTNLLAGASELLPALKINPLALADQIPGKFDTAILVSNSLGEMTKAQIIASPTPAEEVSVPSLIPPTKKENSVEKKASVVSGSALKERPPSELYKYVQADEAATHRLPPLVQEEMKSAELPEPLAQIGIVRPLPLPLNPLQDGKSFNLQEGDASIMRIVSEGALRVRVRFVDLDLPPGAMIYIRSATNPSESYGPYEGRGPFKDGTFWTPPVEGEGIVIEYFNPNTSFWIKSATPPFTISAVSHTFDEILSTQAGSCHPSVPAEWSNAAKAVGALDFISNDGKAEVMCTGTLISNKSSDLTPYLLTANHCINTEAAARTLRVVWFFDSASQSLAGRPSSDFATLLSTRDAVEGSDYSLLMIRGALPTGLVWSGWTTTMPGLFSAVVGIHHPNGDGNNADAYKRIAYGDIGTRSDCNFSTPVTCANFLPVDWDNGGGGTEPGSSGSGLWRDNSANPQLVGQLLGGHSACNNPLGLNSYYGSFDLTYARISGYMESGSDDSLEQDDSRSAARAVAANASYGSLVIKSVDEDWYRVSVPSGSTVSFSVNFEHDFGDIDLALYRASDASPIVTSNSANDIETVSQVNTGGTVDYLVRVFLFKSVRNSYNMNVSVQAGGGTSDTQLPVINISTPTSNSTYATNSNSINLAGNASDNVGVTKVTWTNDRGGSGTASGTTSWTINGIALKSGANTLTVSAQDAAGNIGKATLIVNYTVTVNDTTAPTIKISSPTSSSSYSTTGSTLTLKGTATDNVGVTQVTWTNSRGGSGTASGTTNWTANVTGLQSGTNVLTMRARDAAGNSSAATLTVTYTPPVVCGNGTSVNYRVNGAAPIHPNGTLIKVANNPTVYVLRNGQMLGIPSQEVLHNLYQNGGFADKDVVTVASDELSRYQQPGTVVTSALPSNGRSQPEGRLIKQVGGSEISIVTNNGRRRPFTSESAFLGLGYLYCNVIDAADYNSYPEDPPADAITILNISSVEPSPTQTRDWGGSVTYTFTVTDALGNPVSGAIVGGQDNLMGIGLFIATSSTNGNGQGTWTTTVPNGAVNSLFDIMFLAEKVGYTNSPAVTRQVQVNHFQDTSPPSVFINSPTTSALYNTNVNSITLAGTASDNVGVSQVTWTNDRGGSGTASGTTNWAINGISLQSGTNVLTVTAQDSVGNTGTATVSVIYAAAPTDTNPPAVTITSPTTSSSYETGMNTISLSGIASDNVGVTQVTWINDRGGSGTASGTTNWTVNGINLQSGFNLLTVIAQDASGNVGTADIVVNYIVISTDITGPSLVITNPADGQTVTASSITISGTSSDAGFGDNGISSVTVNGIRASGDTAGGTGTANWSQSVALSPGANTITVLATDNSVNHNSVNKVITVNYQPSAPNPTPQQWVSLEGGGFELAVGRNLDGRLELFVRGFDNALYHKSQLAPNSSSWGGWDTLGGGSDRLVVANNADGRLQVFVRGNDGALWYRSQVAPNSGNWSGWASLGGGFDQLCVGSNADGRIQVFVRGLDKALYYRTQSAPNSDNWNNWSSLGGGVNSTVVASNSDGRMEVFVRGNDNALYHKWQLAPNSDSWSGWDTLGGGTDLFSTGRNADGRLELFARGTDQALYHRHQASPGSSNWSAWASLGAGIDDLAVGKNSSGGLEVFVRGKDGAPYHIWQTAPNADNWSAWTGLGGGIDKLVVGQNASGHPEVFVRGLDKLIYHMTVLPQTPSRGGL